MTSEKPTVHEFLKEIGEYDANRCLWMLTEEAIEDSCWSQVVENSTRAECERLSKRVCDLFSENQKLTRQCDRLERVIAACGTPLVMHSSN